MILFRFEDGGGCLDRRVSCVGGAAPKFSFVYFLRAIT